MRYTPSSGLGTCRYKVKTDKDFGRIIEAIEQHAIRYFFYIGGNDSQDTVNKVHQLANKEGYELRAIGIPKTVDNDLVGIDDCPGYGSVIKYLAAMVREVGLDTEASYSVDKVNVIETMGDAIPAGSPQERPGPPGRRPGPGSHRFAGDSFCSR